MRSAMLLARQMFPNAARQIQRRLGIEVIAGPTTYHADGMTTVHNADFLSDPKFLKAYAVGEATGSACGLDVRWRSHVYCWAATHGIAIEGDFVECGVNRGGLARSAIEYTDFGNKPRKFYLLDTFNGLVNSLLTDRERHLGIKGGGYAECYDAVVQTFAPFKNVLIVRGAVPETLTMVTSEKVAFLSIDMNCVAPEIAAAEYFWPKLSKGAVIVLDDYGWTAHIEQKLAFDKFAVERGVSVLSMPTGQGIIVKPY